MKKTTKDLRLPTGWPTNLGEKIFHRFKGHLEFQESGSVVFEQAVVAGKERQLEFVLNKLLTLYKARDRAISGSL